MIRDSVDLNCDLGESFGAYRLGEDEKILRYVTSANIACGFHAGDPSTMRDTVTLCLEQGVQIGAHPGLPDLAGFGRRHMQISAREACDMVVYQIGALSAFIVSEGGNLRHVKPHGALYNFASTSRDIACAIAEAVYRVNPELILYGLSGSELIRAGKSIGLQTASEVFADRTYVKDGTLTPRGSKGAVIAQADQAVEQAVRMVKQGTVDSIDGTLIHIQADTICIHGDGPHAVNFAKEIREGLEKSSITLAGSAGRS